MVQSKPTNLSVTFKAVVYPSQCDAMGHMTVQYYIAAFDQAMWHMVAELGYDPEWRTTKAKGWADVNYNVNFRNELKVGDLYTVQSSVRKVGSKSLTTFHQMQTLKGEVIADIVMTSTYFDLTNRTAEIIPQDIRVKCLEKLNPESDE